MRGNNGDDSAEEEGESPLREVRGVLEIFNLFCGFPLTVSPADDTVLFVSKKEYVKLAVLILLLNGAGIAYNAYVAMLVPGDSYSDFLMEVFDRSGFTVIDFATVFTGSVIVISSVVVIFIKWISMDKDLTQLCKSLKHICTEVDCNGLGADSKRRAQWKVWPLFIMNVAVFLCMLAANWTILTDTLAVAGQEADPLEKSIISSLASAMCVLFFGPIVAATNFVYHYFVAYMAELFVRWRSSLSKKKLSFQENQGGDGPMFQRRVAPISDKHVGDIGRQIDLGLKLCKTAEEFGNAFSSVIFFLMSYSLLNGVTGAYGASGIIMNEWTNAILLMCAAFSGLGSMMGVQAVMVCNASQRLLDAKAAARDEIEDQMVSAAAASRLSAKNKFKAKILGDRLAEPITPLSFFTLDKSTVMAMAGSNFTYLIVLLQFKVGGMNSDDSMCEENKTSNSATMLNETATENP